MNKYCTQCGAFLEDASSIFCPMCGARIAVEPDASAQPCEDCQTPGRPTPADETDGAAEEPRPCAQPDETYECKAIEIQTSAAQEQSGVPAQDANNRSNGAADPAQRKRISEILQKHASSERFEAICKLLLTQIVLAALCFALIVAGLCVGANELKTNLPSVEKFFEDFAEKYDDWFDIDIDFDSDLNDFMSADMSAEYSMPELYGDHDEHEWRFYEAEPPTEADFAIAIDFLLAILVVILLICFAAGFAMSIVPTVAMFKLRRNSLNETLFSKKSMSALTAIRVILIILMALLIFNGAMMLSNFGARFAWGFNTWAEALAFTTTSLVSLAIIVLGAVHYGLLSSTVGSIRNFISGAAKPPKFNGFNIVIFIIDAVIAILSALIFLVVLICVFSFVHTPILKEFLLGFASLGILGYVCSAAVSIFSAKLFSEIRSELAAE